MSIARLVLRTYPRLRPRLCYHRNLSSHRNYNFDFQGPWRLGFGFDCERERRRVMRTQRVRIFDTTFRDGEQSPCCSMKLEANVLLARKLPSLGVLNTDAGFTLG